MSRTTTNKPLATRNLKLYIPLILLIFAMGLSTRTITRLPRWTILYAGDFLWAMLVFFLFCLIFRLQTGKAFVVALITTYLIEITQLFHPPWLEALREIRLFALVFGFSFLWADILVYTLGICLGALIDWVLLSRVQWGHE